MNSATPILVVINSGRPDSHQQKQIREDSSEHCGYHASSGLMNQTTFDYRHCYDANYAHYQPKKSHQTTKGA